VFVRQLSHAPIDLGQDEPNENERRCYCGWLGLSQ
jgi:hypothetical protein